MKKVRTDNGGSCGRITVNKYIKKQRKKRTRHTHNSNGSCNK